MKLRYFAVVLLLGAICSAQLLTQPRSVLRHTKPAQSADWAISLGNVAGMVFGQYPAIFEAGSTPSCTNDFLVVPISATPSVNGQASILILNQLYRGAGPGLCGTGNAAVKNALAVGTTSITTSPTISLNGTKFAILEPANAKLHIVTVGSGGTVTNAQSPTETVIDYTNITNPNCAGGSVHTANQSDFWVDFATDEGYVGDDGGTLYHFTGVFNGTPTMDFCTSLSSSVLGVPEHWKVGSTDYVFVISNKKKLFRTKVNSTRTAFNGITSLGLSGGNGITERFMPLYDNRANIAYVWTNDNIGDTQASLYQIDALASPMTVKAELQISPSTTTQRYLLGWMNVAFFLNGATDSNARGYTCVYPNGASGAPALASYTFDSSGTIAGFDMTGNTNINPATGTTTGNVCQAVYEQLDTNTGNIALFVSTGNGTTTNTAQVSRFNSTSFLTNSSTPTNVITGSTGSSGIPGGTSSMVSDWLSGALGAQTKGLYFGALTRPTVAKCGGTAPNTNFCIIHVQQSNLQ